MDRAHHRCLAGDSEQAEAIKLAARHHQTLVWERTRHLLRLRAALRRARRRNIEDRATAIIGVLRAEELRRSAQVQAAYAAVVSSQAALLQGLNTQIEAMGEVVEAHFGVHPDAEIYASQPGLGPILGARVLGEFGDDPHRYIDARARKNYAGTAPITKASGKKKVVLARYVRNKRLGDALQQWAFCSLRGSAGAHAYYRQLRDRKIGHQAALRRRPAEAT